MAELQESFEFGLDDYYPNDIPEVYQHIRAGNVPFDTLFRLAAVGRQQLDPTDERTLLRWQLLQDIGTNGGDTEALRPDTRELLYGDLPDVVLDFNRRANSPGYPLLPTMFYTLRDMALVVKQNRLERGIEIRNPLFNKPHISEEEALWLTSVGDARKLWRTLVKRFKPDVIDHPDLYCPPTWSFATVHYPGERTMILRNIANAVISDTAVLTMYNESVTTGVRGIAKVGQELLRRLLLEEHPELSAGHESA